MAFQTQLSLATEYEIVKATARQIKQRADGMIVILANNDVPLAQIVNDLVPELLTARSRLAAVRPGLAQYAKDQENDQSYDVVVEFAALSAEVEATIDWVVANAPASPFLEERTLNVDGSVTPRTLSPAQTAGLRTQLSDLSALIG